MKKNRTRDIPILVMVSEREREMIKERMADAGTINMSAFIRRMTLKGYVLHVDTSPIRDLVSLQRRCSNNLNQIAVNVNTYGGILPEEIAVLQRDYDALWGDLANLIGQLSEVIKL